MSVYSSIEVYDPGAEYQKDNDLHLGFGHGVGWFYQIGVAGGKKTYQGAQYSDDPDYHQEEEMTAISVYEQRLVKTLRNYQTAIGACLRAIELRVPGQGGWLRHDLELMFMAQDWFQRAWLKLPSGIVKLDWSESVWGASQEYLAKWDSPNDSFRFFVELAQDCDDVGTGKLPQKDFAKKYHKYSESPGGVKYAKKKQKLSLEILGDEVVMEGEL